MTDFCDADDYSEEVPDDELEEARSAAEAVTAAEHDSVFARKQWENSQNFPEDEWRLLLT